MYQCYVHYDYEWSTRNENKKELDRNNLYCFKELSLSLYTYALNQMDSRLERCDTYSTETNKKYC